MLTESQKIDHLIKLGIVLNQVQDLDILLEKILKEARKFTNADAGSIYIREKDELLFKYTQNETLQQKLSKGEKLVYSAYKIPVNNKSIAGFAALTGNILNISDVYNISSDEPYSFLEQFDKKTGYKSKSVCTIPLITAKKNIVGILQIINARDQNNNICSFSDSDEKMMFHFANIASVALKRAKMNRATFMRMLSMSDMHDPKETSAHINRVGSYAVEVYDRWASNCNISTSDIEKNRDILRIAAMLHDVGKVGISDLILKKTGKYNQDEFEIMKQHTILGARLFMDSLSEYDEACYEVTLNHHEKWDGHGYPGYVNVSTGKPLEGYGLPGGKAIGKKGKDIPVFARIVTVVDVYDALISERCYKGAWEESKVLDEIKKGAGNHFDPEIVDVFFSVYPSIKSIQERYVD